MRSESQVRVVRGAALLPVTHHRSLRPQVFRPVDRTIAQRKDECGSIMAVLYCVLTAVALEVFNTGKASVDAGAGMRGVGWKRVCLLEERWHCISYHFFLSHHNHRCIGIPEHACCTSMRVGNLLPAARGALHCTRAREGDLFLARGVLLGILDLAAKLAGLTFEMPAEPVGVLLALTVRPRVLAVDLRCACVSGLEGLKGRTLAQTYLERFRRKIRILLVHLSLVRPWDIFVAAESLAGALHPALGVGLHTSALTKVSNVVTTTIIRAFEGVHKRRSPRGGHVGVRGAGHKERESGDSELHRFAWCGCWCWLLERRRGDAAC